MEKNFLAAVLVIMNDMKLYSATACLFRYNEKMVKLIYSDPSLKGLYMYIY